MRFWVYGKESCPYCKLAVELLEECGQKVSYIDIKDVSNTARWATVPQIFNEAKHIGGYEDLQKFIGGNEL